MEVAAATGTSVATQACAVAAAVMAPAVVGMPCIFGFARWVKDNPGIFGGMNDKFLHCYVTCRAAKICGSISALMAAALAEVIQQLCLYPPMNSTRLCKAFGGTFSIGDILADAVGMSCAGIESQIPIVGGITNQILQLLGRSNCWDCCSRQYPQGPKPTIWGIDLPSKPWELLIP